MTTGPCNAEQFYIGAYRKIGMPALEQLIWPWRLPLLAARSPMRSTPGIDPKPSSVSVGNRGLAIVSPNADNQNGADKWKRPDKHQLQCVLGAAVHSGRHKADGRDEV
jgi:hypothetical protein